MDFKELISDIKEKVISLWNKGKDFVLENKVLSLAIGGLVLVIIISVIILISAVSKPKKETTYQRDLTLTEELLIPPSPAVPDGYNLSRTTKDTWSEEETDVWFTTPSEKEIDDLSRANDRLVQDIIGAAP